MSGERPGAWHFQVGVRLRGDGKAEVDVAGWAVDGEEHCEKRLIVPSHTAFAAARGAMEAISGWNHVWRRAALLQAAEILEEAERQGGEVLVAGLSNAEEFVLGSEVEFVIRRPQPECSPDDLAMWIDDVMSEAGFNSRQYVEGEDRRLPHAPYIGAARLRALAEEE